MNILITGVAGSGKSTISKELQSRGYIAYDTDSIKDLSAWVDLKTGMPNYNFERKSADDWVDKYDWQWDEKKLLDLIAKGKTKTQYICGSSGNQSLFYSLFDKIFLLEMNEQLLRHRILNSQREHDYGRAPGELEVILKYFKDFQDKAIKNGAIVIDANKPVNEIISFIQGLVDA